MTNFTNPHSKNLLIGIDKSDSPVHKSIGSENHRISYTAFGHCAFLTARSVGFTGQLNEPASGRYLLGNGYRAYSPSTMRFDTYDDLSPFGAGGLNGYAYCAADPVNNLDPSGHIPFKGFFSLFSRVLGKGVSKTPKSMIPVVSLKITKVNQFSGAINAYKPNPARLGIYTLSNQPRRVKPGTTIIFGNKKIQDDKIALGHINNALNHNSRLQIKHTIYDIRAHTKPLEELRNSLWKKTDLEGFKHYTTVG